jgi:hypothetical protein
MKGAYEVHMYFYEYIYLVTLKYPAVPRNVSVAGHVKYRAVLRNVSVAAHVKYPAVHAMYQWRLSEISHSTRNISVAADVKYPAVPPDISVTVHV